jgi:hypothetical protein
VERFPALPFFVVREITNKILEKIKDSARKELTTREEMKYNDFDWICDGFEKIRIK